MAKATTRDPYEAFLSTRGAIGAAADRVLAGIGEFGRLTTREDFVEASALLSQATSAGQPESTMREMLERHLRPGRLDEGLLRRLSFVARAIEVAHGHSSWHHQIVCALLLKRGVLVEMANGSGKTLAIAMAAATSLGATATHVATGNDYLAERDARWMAPLFALLGLTVGVVFTDQSPQFRWGIMDADGVTLRVAPRDGVKSETSPGGSDGERHGQPAADGGQLAHVTTAGYRIDDGLTLKSVLLCDVVYAKVEAFGFAYLNDNLTSSPEQQVLTRRDALVVDECDTVLLDDLLTPIIVNRSRFTKVSAAELQYLHQVASSLERDRDFVVNGQGVQLTFDGLAHAEAYAGIEIFTPEHGKFAVGLLNALTALHGYVRDIHYVVDGTRATLIDKATGRLLYGRRLGGGLHEAVEIKEGLRVGDVVDFEPSAKITVKHLVKTYAAVSGTSGSTGPPEEYERLYNLEVVSVVPYPQTRRDHGDLVYRTRREAIAYGVVAKAVERSGAGQPVLINVPTLKDVDVVVGLLAQADVQYQALDALSVTTLGEEAERTGRAGTAGLITVCSKVAARGTDIVLDPQARAAGGLFVIGLQREVDRRYDDQLRGRAGRHGDPGDSLFVVSLEDDLMRMLGSQNIQGLMQRLGMDEGEPIESPMVSRAIARSQRVAERQAHLSRLRVVDLDDILDRHRLVVYRVRQQMLTTTDFGPDLRVIIANWITVRSKRDGDSLGRNPVVDSLEPTEIGRIANVRSPKVRAGIIKEILEGRTAVVLGDSELSRLYLRHAVLDALDTQWRGYLTFEEATRQQISLYNYDDPRPWARYAQAMEERFDSFFHDVGEQILGFVVDVSREMTQRSLPAAPGVRT